MTVWTTTELARQLGALGVRKGGVLLVHTSFRAVRPVEGGPRGLIEALMMALGPAGTLVMPSWSGNDDEPFDPETTPAAADLGVVADTFWRLPGVRRSDHFFAFAAAGPAADRILADPLPLPPHIPESPVGRVHELDGQVLLLGVGHESNTTLHLAEIIAGVPYRVPKSLTVLRDGRSERIEYGENDHCCQRFALAGEWLRERGLQREGRVGNAHARLIRSRDVVDVAVEHLRLDPLVFLHPVDAGCEDCDAARRSISAGRGGSMGPRTSADRGIRAEPRATAGESAPDALDRHFAIVYDQLRRLAAAVRRGRAGETLNTTALVHEAYMKLAGSEHLTWRDRGHFFRIAARAMRQVLADAAARQRTAKRGGALVTLHEGLDAATTLTPTDILDLNRALTELGERNPRQLAVVECRIFAGLSVEETAEAVGASVPTVVRDWRFARAWLSTRLSGSRPAARAGGPENGDAA